MKKKFSLEDFTKNKTTSNILASVIAALCGLLFGFIIIIISNPDKAFEAFGTILAGGFGDGLYGIGQVLYYATPILMTGLSVAFAFKTGLFNIGASGQFTVGMLCSLYTAFLLKDVVTSNFLWVICALAGALGGAIWGFIPGIFKALLNVNEVITCIMTNYIGMYLVDMIVNKNPLIYNENSKWTKIMPSNANLPTLGLDILFEDSYVSSGIVIAIILAIVLYIILNKTKFGYELRACGLNKEGAKYAGVNQNSRIILAMVICGAICGLGGAMRIQDGTNYTYAPVSVMDTNGFNGIAVALLGTSDPIGTIFAALFFSHIKQGGFYMQACGVKSEIIDVIVGAVIYFSAFALIIKNYLPVIAKKITDRKKLKATKIVEEKKEE